MQKGMTSDVMSGDEIETTMIDTATIGGAKGAMRGVTSGVVSRATSGVRTGTAVTTPLGHRREMKADEGTGTATPGIGTMAATRGGRGIPEENPVEMIRATPGMVRLGSVR